MSINYQDRIPNNVDLGSNRTLQRALEHWQPEFLKWWEELGPKDFQVADVYLRTATSVDAKGWATYGYVRMPDYRWGIFLNERDPNRRVGFGDDTAAAGGLVRWTARGQPRFAGDALSDPVTGLAAALGALQGLAAGGGVLVDAAMAKAAAAAAALAGLEVAA